jgi:hypothetical protein
VYAGVPDNAAKFGAAKIPDAGAATLGARAEAVWKATAGAKVAAAAGAKEAAAIGAAAEPIKVPVAAPPASEARKALPAIAGAAADIAPANGIAAAAIIIPLTNVI